MAPVTEEFPVPAFQKIMFAVVERKVSGVYCRYNIQGSYSANKGLIGLCQDEFERQNYLRDPLTRKIREEFERQEALREAREDERRNIRFVQIIDEHHPFPFYV